MGFHTFPTERADNLEDVARFRFCSREELVSLLDVDADAVVADLGSGTGFYTREVAPFVGTLYAVDLQPEMHDHHREHGVDDNVELLTSGIDSLPFEDDELDGAFSTMTHHEYATDEALAELARVIGPGGRLVTVDWSADGDGTDGPAVDERFTTAEVSDQLEAAGFEIVDAHVRPETMVVVARVAE